MRDVFLVDRIDHVGILAQCAATTRITASLAILITPTLSKRFHVIQKPRLYFKFLAIYQRTHFESLTAELTQLLLYVPFEGVELYVELFVGDHYRHPLLRGDLIFLQQGLRPDQVSDPASDLCFEHVNLLLQDLYFIGLLIFIYAPKQWMSQL